MTRDWRDYAAALLTLTVYGVTCAYLLSHPTA